MGDDAALKAILAFCTKVIHKYCANILISCRESSIAEGFDNASDRGDIMSSLKQAITFHSAIGQFDIGQALIIQDRRIFVEGAEGTRMLLIKRTAAFIDENYGKPPFFQSR